MKVSKDTLILDSKKFKIGLIISITEMHNYHLEILEDGITSHVSEKNDLKVYPNIQDAQITAKKLGCKKLYLCLDNTYDECGGNGQTHERFSYMPLN